LNVYDIVRHEWVLITKRAAKAVETRLQVQE
jgi:ribosomal protein L4